MRVISKKKDQARRVTCGCGAELEYTNEDISIGEFGCGFIVCPECEEEIYLDDKGQVLTIDSVKFPKHFASFEDGVSIDDKEINNWISDCLHDLEIDELDYRNFRSTGNGNTVVIVHKYEDEYAVYVAQKYYMTSIPRN